MFNTQSAIRRGSQPPIDKPYFRWINEGSVRNNQVGGVVPDEEGALEIGFVQLGGGYEQVVLDIGAATSARRTSVIISGSGEVLIYLFGELTSTGVMVTENEYTLVKLSWPATGAGSVDINGTVVAVTRGTLISSLTKLAELSFPITGAGFVFNGIIKPYRVFNDEAMLSIHKEWPMDDGSGLEFIPSVGSTVLDVFATSGTWIS